MSLRFLNVCGLACRAGRAFLQALRVMRSFFFSLRSAFPRAFSKLFFRVPRFTFPRSRFPNFVTRSSFACLKKKICVLKKFFWRTWKINCFLCLSNKTYITFLYKLALPRARCYKEEFYSPEFYSPEFYSGHFKTSSRGRVEGPHMRSERCTLQSRTLQLYRFEPWGWGGGGRAEPDRDGIHRATL